MKSGYSERKNNSSQSFRNLTVRRLPSSVVVAFALVMTGPALALCATALFEEGSGGAQEKFIDPTWGVSADMYIADPTYTTATKSAVLAAVTIFFDGEDEWIQYGYIKGWVQIPSTNEWYEYTTPWTFVEWAKISTGQREVSLLNGVQPDTWHTFEIQFNRWSDKWECYKDGDHDYTLGWAEPTYGTRVIVQGECFDDNDQTNGVMHFHDLKYLKYNIARRGTLTNPTWMPWNGYTDTLCESPWSISPSSNEFDCWIDDPVSPSHFDFEDQDISDWTIYSPGNGIVDVVDAPDPNPLVGDYSLYVYAVGTGNTAQATSPSIDSWDCASKYEVTMEFYVVRPKNMVVYDDSRARLECRLDSNFDSHLWGIGEGGEETDMGVIPDYTWVSIRIGVNSPGPSTIFFVEVDGEYRGFGDLDTWLGPYDTFTLGTRNPIHGVDWVEAYWDCISIENV